MNRTVLRRRLTGINIEDRVPIIQEYLQELPESEVQKYKDFYYASLQALKQNQGVTRAERELSRGSYLIFGIKYSTLHQIACVAANQPVRTPKMEMDNNGLKTKHSTNNSYPKGKSISRLMECGPAKIRRGIKRANPFDDSD